MVEEGRHRVPVVLDTDIGTDVDDLLALLVLATEASVDLQAVTTVYGDVDLRARLAARALRLLGRGDVPVHAGAAAPRSGREVWWLGHEGRDIDGLEDEAVAANDGVAELLAAADRHPGELVVVAIGPLTNVATALERDPAWPEKVDQLVVMGGEFAQARPEHNVRSDVVAAGEVLVSRLDARFVGYDVTTTVWFDEDDLDAVVAPGGELAELVARQVNDWWAHLGAPRCHPHDPLAALNLLEPELFTMARGTWRVLEDEDRAGALVPDDQATPVAYATGVDVQASRAAIVRRLTDAIAGSAG